MNGKGRQNRTRKGQNCGKDGCDGSGKGRGCGRQRRRRVRKGQKEDK